VSIRPLVASGPVRPVAMVVILKLPDWRCILAVDRGGRKGGKRDGFCRGEPFHGPFRALANAAAPGGARGDRQPVGDSCATFARNPAADLLQMQRQAIGDTNYGCKLGAVSEAFDSLLAQVRACTVCAPHLPLGPRPVLRGRPSARLLIISQELRRTPSH
jgi:hypothetical protein